MPRNEFGGVVKKGSERKNKNYLIADICLNFHCATINVSFFKENIKKRVNAFIRIFL